VTLGLLLLAGCARVAGAQTYVWTDERGVVHAASDPSEVPASQRAKAIRDAEGRRDSVTISPDPTPPAAPDSSNMGTGLDVEPEVTPDRAAEPEVEPKQKRLNPNKLPPPAPGFEWNCPTDPEGGPPKCEQFETKSSKRARRADAREKAKRELKIKPGDEFDPDVARRVNERAEQEFKKTTPVPTVEDSANTETEEGSEAGDEESGDLNHSDDEPGDD
jgi:hypothetical protein